MARSAYAGDAMDLAAADQAAAGHVVSQVAVAATTPASPREM